MEPRRKASLLWGVVGAMAFLVLVQGYHLVADTFLGVGPVALGTVVVLVVTAAAALSLQPRPAENESP